LVFCLKFNFSIIYKLKKKKKKREKEIRERERTEEDEGKIGRKYIKKARHSHMTR
jgi:hypothetical protein